MPVCGPGHPLGPPDSDPREQRRGDHWSSCVLAGGLGRVTDAIARSEKHWVKEHFALTAALRRSFCF